MDSYKELFLNKLGEYDVACGDDFGWSIQKVDYAIDYLTGVLEKDMDKIIKQLRG